ncbi:ATP synthase F0 subunit C [Nonomuraea sp. NPDC003707]
MCRHPPTAGSGNAEARTGSQGVQAIARQPEAYGLIRQNMLLGLVLTEASALLGLVAPFIFQVVK